MRNERNSVTTVNIDPSIIIEWLRGEVIQVQNSIFFCLCHFGKVKYIENNILKYLRHSFKIARLINQHTVFHFQN